MARVPQQICPCCGRFQDDSEYPTTGHLCAECSRQPSPLTQMRAPYRYLEPLSRIIHRYKYDGYFGLATPLAELMIDGWPVWEQAVDLILPIPLHPRRQRRRGYNQSQLLAQRLGKELGIDCEPFLLRRTRHTAPQVGLGPEARRENVRGAFLADAGLAGRHVLLVDDVLTTGETMKAAAEALLTVGVASVSSYCLARVS